MKSRLILKPLACLALASVSACSSSRSSTDERNDAGQEAGGVGDVNDAADGALGGRTGQEDGGAATGGVTTNGGSGGRLDTSAWGPCQMLPVPAGISAAGLRTSPTVAPKCLPAGSTVSRAMALMATSTSQKRHKVKVLFYGQSITKAGWVPETEAYLRSTFPYTDFEIREEAIGGFLAQMLIRTAEHDVLPWYPDLMIYHSYTAGNYLEYDAIMQLVRRRTTTEIMQQTHHVTVNGAASEDRESYAQIPSIANRLGYYVIDIGTPWKDYLLQNSKTPQDLTLGTKEKPDGVHPNAEGNALMAKITNAHLKYDANVIVDPLGLVTTYEVGKDIKWEGKKLVVNFEGNRVVFLAKGGMKHAPNTASVTVDGKRPSEFPSAYAITRPNGDFDSDWPWMKGSVIRVTMDPTQQPVVEEWTMTLTSIDKEGECTFNLSGSVTGPDGTGRCKADFTSRSKRMRIAKSDYYFRDPQTVLATAISGGDEFKWKVYPLHVDTYPPVSIDATDASREYPTTVIQAISNGAHTLELTATGDSAPAVEFIQVHRPPLR